MAIDALIAALPDIFGAGAAGAGAAAAGAGAADLGATAGLGALGTATDFLAAPTFDALGGSALAGTGADVLSTAGSALAFPDLLGGAAAAGIGGAAADAALTNAASSGLATGTGSIPAASAPIDALLSATPTAGFGATAIGGVPSGSSALPSNVANANASASVFDTGTTPIQGAGIQPGTGSAFQPAGASAAGASAPTGVGGATDATSAGAGATAGQTAGATGAAAPAAGQSSSISQLLSKAGNSITNNALPAAIGAAGLGYNIFEGQKQTANQKALSADAATATANSNTLVAQGQALQQYLTSGTLPPQYMQQVDQAINDAKTTAISNAAAQGLPTDPAKNSALAASLASIENQKAGMISQVAGQLFSSGSSLVNAGQTAAGLSGNLYQALVQNDTTQAGNIGKSIASLAAALNGKTQANIGGTNITLSNAA